MPNQLAIARNREFIENESLLICTSQGSALSLLSCPFEASLFFPKTNPTLGSFQDLAPAFEGPVNGQFQPISVIQIRHRKSHFVVRIQLYQPIDQSKVNGSWLCIKPQLLDSHNALFFYQIKGLPVRKESGGRVIAHIFDYMETNANAVIIVKRVDNQELVYLPLHADYVSIDQVKSECIVPDFDDFL